jgi:hypothetical protein
MTYYPVTAPYPVFSERDGTPLEDGYIYIGELNQNPVTNPITVTWDAEGFYPAAQPIRTIGGFPDRNGSPSNIYINSGDNTSYSILIQDKHEQLVYSSPDALSAMIGSGGSVENLGELRLITYYNNPVYLRGHTSAGDGGDGYFEYTSGAAPGTYTDNDGSIILPTGGDGSSAWLRQNTEVTSVKHFGATGDGTTDDTIAIQAAIDAYMLSNGGSLFFPYGQYRVTDTLNFGIWSIDNVTNDVLGYARTKNGVRVRGESGNIVTDTNATIIWDGGYQAGDNVTVITDSVGPYNYIDNDKPVIQFLGCRGITIDNLSINGNDEAHSCIIFDGNHYGVTINNCKFIGARIGVRIAKSYRHDTYASYYGHHDSPYLKTVVGINMPALGGIQCDTYAINNLVATNCEKGISVESAQALGMNFRTMWIRGASAVTNWKGYAGILNAGGRLNIDSVGFGGSFTYCIWNLANTSTINVQEIHDETTATYTYAATTSSVTNRFTAINGDMQGIYLPAGSGIVVVENVTISGPVLRGADNSASYECLINLKNLKSTYNGALINLGTVANKENVIVNTSNITLTGGSAVITNSYNNFVGTVKNTTPTQTYNIYRGLLYRDGWDYQQDRGYSHSDGIITNFSGYKTGIADETLTDLCLFNQSNSNCFYVTMDITLQTGPSSNIAHVNKKIGFSWVTDNAGNTTLSAVTEIYTDSVVDGVASITATFTTAVVGTDIILRVNQNNEAIDVNVTATYSGRIMGGYNGGSVSRTRFEPQ